MAIHKPGEKFRNHFLLSRNGHKRGLVAVLSLTAMVDMFTVLVIFLLQNFSTDEIIFTPKDVKLPKAEKIKDLKPAVVVTISNTEILVDKTPVITYEALKTQEDWLVSPLKDLVMKGLKDAKEKFEAKLQNQLRQVVANSPNAKDKPKTEPEDPEPWNKVTVQADKGMDFLSVKKVLYTVTEAGAGEINFAVMKQPEDKTQ